MRNVRQQLRITQWPDHLPLIEVQRASIVDRDGWLFEVEQRDPAPLPDELILRGFQQLDCRSDHELLAFLNQYGSVTDDPLALLRPGDPADYEDSPPNRPRGSFGHLEQVMGVAQFMQASVRHWVFHVNEFDVTTAWTDLLPDTSEAEAWQYFLFAFAGLQRFHPIVALLPSSRPLAAALPRMGLLSGLAAQLFNLVHEEAPVLECSNESCSQWFIRQQGRSIKGQSRASGVLYCSPSCAKASAQRAYRRRATGGVK